jgi:gliding motility-associated-like protein
VPGAIIDLYNPSTHCFDFVFDDPNSADSLFVTSSSNIFSFDNVDSLTFEIDQGVVNIPFCWDVICEDVRDEPYFVDFEVVATNCEVQDTTTFTVPIQVIVPENEPTEFIQPLQEYTWEFYSQETFCMPITVTDGNFFDTLQVSAESEIFSVPGNPPVFDTLNGNSILQDTLCWTPICANVREEPYRITYTATANSCKTNDEVVYPVDIYLTLPPENEASFSQPTQLSYEHFIGDDPLDITVFGTDPDPNDSLSLSAASDAFGVPGSSASFESQGFFENILGTFLWPPDCPDVRPEPYDVTFTLTSRSCQKIDTINLNVDILVTTPTKGDIEPIANVFTPNGDGRNDAWTIENMDDPCLLDFEAQIFDRWGKEVYITKNPAFQWNGEYDGGNEANTGVYFQTIEFIYRQEKQSYTGNIEILR